MNYEVWLHARDPKSLELVATLRVFTHPDRLAAEGALENAEALFQGDERGLIGLPFGSLASAHMVRPEVVPTRELAGAYAVAVEALQDIAAVSEYSLDAGGCARTARGALTKLGERP